MIDLKCADISSYSKEDRDSIYIACESFKSTKGFEMFFNHMLNLYISTNLGLNKIRHDQGVIPISDERFSGGVEMINFLKNTVLEYSQAKALSTNKTS